MKFYNGKRWLSKSACFFIILPIIISFASPVFGQDSRAVNEKPVISVAGLRQNAVHEITGGETQEFVLNLGADEFIRVIVGQQIDVELSLYDSKGERVALIDTLTPEQIVFVSRQAGEYRLRVKALAKPETKDTYTIESFERRPAQKTDDDLVRAQTLFTEAKIANRQSSTAVQETAIPKYQEAAKLRLAAKMPELAATAFNNIGTVQHALAQYRNALESFQRALSLRPPDSRANLPARINIGLIYSLLGEPQKAVDAYNSALAMNSEDERVKAILLNNIGLIYQSYEPLRAAEYFRQAVEAANKTEDSKIQAGILVNLGGAYNNSDQFPQSIESFQKALEIYQKIKDPFGPAHVYRGLGAVYRKTNDKHKALENLNKALALFQANKDLYAVIGAHQQIGLTQMNAGDFTAALESIDQALALARRISLRREEMLALYNTAQVYSKQGDVGKALEASEAALQVFETVRAGIISQSLRDSTAGTLRNLYDLYIQLLMTKYEQSGNGDFAARALEASERGRARSLLQLLTESWTDIRQGVDAELLKRESEIANLLRTKTDQQSRLLARGNAPAEQLAALSREIASLTDQYDAVRALIRQKSPNFAALTQPQPLGAREIQNLLDKDTVLLEYALGDSQSTLMLVTNDSISAYKLPKREEIENVARRFYDSLKTNGGAPDAQAGNSLSEMLLKPVGEKLAGKRIIVVSEGALQYIPFAALPSPNAAAGQFLIQTNEIANLPSASTLAVLRRENANRETAPKSIAVFADPVFSANDPRLKNPSIAKAASRLDEGLQRSFEEIVESGGSGEEILKTIPRLPFSRREAEAILQNAPADQRLKAVDFAANAEKVTSRNLADYKIVHFATHGLLNSKNPELSGLVLSLVNEKGEAQNGFLRLNDIYNLRLNSDLVVLSACQTALGKDIRGEGLIGLTRGFMYAGAPRVVASLWKVDDAATAELMKRFYQNMLAKKQRPAEALRAAQIEMSKDERFKSPYFWAAFTLQGEWR